MRKYTFIVVLSLAGILGSCSNEETAEIPVKNPVMLTWNGIEINLQNEPQWCVSRSNHWIALSNYEKKTQYYLLWGGDMVPGVKDNGELRISIRGRKPVSYPLESLVLRTDGLNCTLVFQNEKGEEGVFSFPL